MNMFTRLSMWLGAVCLGVIAAVFSLAQAIGGHPRWLKTVIAFDQAFNAAVGGSEDMTLSTRAARARTAGKRWGCVLCWLLDKVDPRHCEDSDKANA